VHIIKSTTKPDWFLKPVRFALGCLLGAFFGCYFSYRFYIFFYGTPGGTKGYSHSTPSGLFLTPFLIDAFDIKLA
jgi:hypothetical protein